MKILCLLFFIFTAIPAGAQFYAPEVYYHDAAQRLFVVEAARVHAWIENQTGAGIASVAWEAKGGPKGSTVWKLAWKNAGGEVLRTQELSYNIKELNGGVDFYRPLWRKIRGIATDKTQSGPPDAPAQMQAYWAATQNIGTSRMSGVNAIDTFVREHAPVTKAEDAAALSSMLVHSALPMLAGACTLDYTLLARSAAWLCHAEDLCGSRLRTAWAPLLYLAGREKAAGERWQEFVKPGSQAALAAQWWECILRTRPAPLRDVVLFAAEPGHAGWGLPFLAANLRLDGVHEGELASIIDMLYGKKMEAWCDMGPLFSHKLGMSAMRPFITQAPYIARRNWLYCLGKVCEQSTDAAARARLPAIKATQAQMAADTEEDMALRGLQGAADLINAGYELPAAKTSLVPVAGITAEDLMIFGWDQTVSHMSEWYHFLNNVLGVGKTAEAVEQACHKAVPTLAYWVKKQKTKTLPEVEIALKRVEFFDTHDLFHPGFAVPADQQAQPPLRNWLVRGTLSQTHLWTLANRAPKDFSLWPHLETLLAQGGEDACARCFHFLIKELKPEDREQQKKTMPQLFERARAGCPNALALHRMEANLDEPGKEPDDFARGRAVERLWWEAPGVWNTSTIMDRYITANAMESAKRFYSQSLPVARNMLSYMNGLPECRWVIAWLEEDREGMNDAARDAPNYSKEDLTKQLRHHLAVGEDAQALRLLQTLMERYPSGPSGKIPEMRLWRDFMPLLPALADARHAQHEEALTYFSGDKSASMPTLRFILARRFKLPVEEAVKFIGSEQPSPQRRALIAYLRKDEKEFTAAYALVKNSEEKKYFTAGRTLIECLRHEMLKIAPLPDQPDLRPAKVELLDELVRNKIER